MQLSLPQLSAHLQRGLRNLYVLHGDEPLLVQEAADALRAAARAQGFSERSVHTVQGAHFDWSAVLAAASALSLFADKQILELRIPTGKPGKEGSVALQQLVDNLQGNADILVLVMLTSFYWLIEIVGLKKPFLPLVVVGMNSIFIYVMHSLAAGWIKDQLSKHGMAELFATTWGPVIEKASVLAVLWLLCFWLYRQRAFLRL